MPVSLYDFTIGYFIRGCYTMSHILEKAVAYAKEKNIDVNEIPTWKLIDDMRPFSFQVQTMSNTAKNSIKRITGKELPVWEDNETTVDELFARINKTVELLKSIDRASIEVEETRSIELKFGQNEMKFTGLSYAQNYCIPNFDFHLDVGYSILRMKGVQIGKQDALSGGFKASAEGL
jgi:uncharacterized protein